jgi:hypothetical protein
MDRVLLIEDSGFTCRVSEIPENVLKEANSTGMMVLKGIPATVLDEKNGNGRTYSKQVLEHSINKLRHNGAFKNKRMLCSADDHPKDSSHVSPIQSSHVILDAYIKKNDKGKDVLMNDWLVLNTSNGKNLKALAEAGASFGTSIRGLGQLNEETKHVENYDWLGTDAVGNPSAGTFASPGTFEIKTESISAELASMITEQLENSNMFDLKRAVDQFRAANFDNNKLKGPISTEVTKSLLAMQRSAVEGGVKDLTLLENLTDQIYGTESSTPLNNLVNYDKDKNQDALNKALRELEATQNLAVHYKTMAESFEQDHQQFQTKLAAYEEVSATIYEELENSVAQLNDGSSAAQARDITERSLRTVRRIQKEARDLILNLETRLDNTIRIGDQFAENAIVLRRIVNTLYQQLIEIQDRDPKSFVSSKGTQTRVSEKLEGKRPVIENRDKSHGPVPSPSYSGNRAGWV